MSRITAAAAVSVIVFAAAPARADDDALYACKKAPAGLKLTTSFAPGATLHDLAVWYMSFTCSAVVYSEEVSCRTPGANLLVPEPITVAEAKALFFDAIEVMGLKARVTAKKVVITEPAGTKRVTPPGCVTGAPTAAVNPAAAAPDSIPLDPDAHVTRIDPTHYEVKRALVDAALAEPIRYSGGGHVVPAVKNGKPDGFKIYTVRPSSLWAHLGLVTGDTIQRIDGVALDSADLALEAFEKLKTATAVKVSISRKANPIVLEYKIIK